MQLSEKLQILRKTKGYSQEEIAEMLDVSRQAVAKWEAIWKAGIAVYAMNYVGRVLNEKFSGNFLKEALKAADEII